MRQACEQLHQWQQKKLAQLGITISVNLSVREFSQPNLLAQIDEIIHLTKLDPQNLKLEITESAIMDTNGEATRILKQMKQRKIELSIDDFGTGYSSLSYLNRLPVDTLKIDRSFIQPIDNQTESLGLVPAIINLAQTLRMSVIAEGIETPQQLAQLRELNCAFGQGYFFAKPLDAKSAEALLEADPQY